MIGDVLRKTRKIYGFNASQMSKSLGISPSYLSEIETSKKKPSLDLLEKYSDIYGIKLSSLILLSEKLDNVKGTNKEKIFIQKMMTNLVNLFSKEDEINEEEPEV